MSLTATGPAGVASSHPLAAAAGAEALSAGGSAVDAALAAAFTQWVVNAPQCGPGGEMVALVANSSGDTGDGGDGGDGGKTGDGGDGVRVYPGWSRVPLAISDPAEAGGRAASAAGWPPTSGPGNAVVPGSLRGAEAVWRAHGRLNWSDLFAGGLAAAAGHEVTPRMADVYRLVESRGHVEALQRMIGTSQAPEAGSTIRMPVLASTLAVVAAGGAGAFYHGELADRLVSAAEREGAPLRHDDLDAVDAVVEPAQRLDLGEAAEEMVVWVPGPPSQAPITLALLAAVPAGADPASRAFAEALAPLTEQQLTEFCTRAPARPEGTTVSTAVDAAGMSATVVHSLAGVQFGTGWVADGTGVAFSNRVGTALSERADLPGCNPRPGALLPHTLSAAHVKGRTGWMTVATPGGDRQVQWLAQAIQRYRLGAGAQTIASGPRWFVCPTGDRFGVPAGIGQPWYAFAEPGIEWRDDERLAGYEIKAVDSEGGGLQVVIGTDGTDGAAFRIASDHRAGGAAIAIGA